VSSLLVQQRQKFLNVLGSQLRDSRKRYGISASLLASVAGVSRHTVLRWEAGQQGPDAFEYIQIKRFLQQFQKSAPSARRSFQQRNARFEAHR
jgi:predicted transcriptional regulator